MSKIRAPSARSVAEVCRGIKVQHAAVCGAGTLLEFGTRGGVDCLLQQHDDSHRPDTARNWSEIASPVHCLGEGGALIDLRRTGCWSRIPWTSGSDESPAISATSPHVDKLAGKPT